MKLDFDQAVLKWSFLLKPSVQKHFICFVDLQNTSRDQLLNKTHSLFRYAMPSTEEEIREAFRVFDKNNDGFITSDELKRILTKVREVSYTFSNILRHS